MRCWFFVGVVAAFSVVPSTGTADSGLCGNEAIRAQQGATYLPDCRAYELVSPSGVSNIERSLVQASSDGTRVTFSSADAFAGAQQSTRDPYLATRTTQGWQPTPLVAPLTRQEVPLFYNTDQRIFGFSSDFADLYLKTQDGIDPNDTNEKHDIYLWRSSGAFAWASNGSSQFGSGISRGYAGNSSDGSTVVIQGNDRNLYESIDGGPVSTINLDLSDTLLAYPRLGNWRTGVASVGTSRNAVSADGKYIFFESNAESQPVLWVRQGGTTTALIADHGVFGGASADGSKVFFTTEESLVPGDTGGNDLYEYELATDTYRRLSAGADPNPRVIPNTVVNSDDGRRVYFAARGVLTTEPNAEGDSPVDGARNLYLSENGELRFVTQVSDSGESTFYTSGPSGSIHAVGSTPVYDLTPSGQYLAFITSAALLPADTDSQQDVYVYNAVTGALTLGSVGPSGGNGAAKAELGGRGHFSAGYAPPMLSSDGRYLYFQTSESLVPRDSNGVVDVYERSLVTGTTSLISSGQSQRASEVFATSATGRDVLFITEQPLAVQDQDAERSVYDARIDGGFPVLVSPSCVGEGCRGAASGPPALHAPGSEALNGRGNLRPHGSCRAFAHRARKLSRRSQQLRRQAAHRHRGKAKAMRRRARQLAGRAHRLSLDAKHCRRASRRALR